MFCGSQVYEVWYVACQEGLLFWSSVIHLHTCPRKCACAVVAVVLKLNGTCQTVSHLVNNKICEHY